MKKNNKHNDFERNECLIAKYLNDVFKEQIPDEDIPKPDLSFMYAEDGDAAHTAGPRTRVKNKPRFPAMRRVATAFCAICAIFVVSSGMTVMLSDSEAYAGNPVAMFFNRYICCMISSPEGDIDYSEESYDQSEIFDESKIVNIKKMLPEMVLIDSVPNRYEFTSLKLEEYGTGYFTYIYEYKNVSDPEDILRITGCKQSGERQVILYGNNVKINSANVELYCRDDMNTGGMTGTCLMSSQILTISGKLLQDEIIEITESMTI